MPSAVRITLSVQVSAVQTLSRHLCATLHVPMHVRFFCCGQLVCIWRRTRASAARRHENNPRTFKEIGAVVSNASKKEIGRCFKDIIKELEQDMGTIHAANYMRRFGSHLGLANKDIQAAEEAAEVACPRDGRRASTPRRGCDLRC
jgi:hypothetical protein